MLHADRAVAVSGAGDTGAWDAVQIAPGDDVAVALRPLSGTARVSRDGQIEEVILLDAIPFGHKFALSDLAAGHAVKKYGAPIGRLTQDVGRGGHVHVHNLKSRRAAGGN